MTKPINLAERKKQKGQGTEQKRIYRERYLSMPERDRKLLDLIYAKINATRELNEFMGESNDAYLSLTYIEFNHLNRINDYLYEKK